MHKHLKPALFALLAFGLTGCGAVDRIEAIGQAPKLAPVGSPAEREIVARIPRAHPITPRAAPPAAPPAQPPTPP